MKYFKIEEFKCKCGCGKAEMNQKFTQMLDMARGESGVPFHITSGYRCPKHNKNVGSTSTNHTLGVAADIACNNGGTRLKIIDALLAVGFKRIGVHKNFIHADINEMPASVWLY